MVEVVNSVCPFTLEPILNRGRRFVITEGSHAYQLNVDKLYHYIRTTPKNPLTNKELSLQQIEAVNKHYIKHRLHEINEATNTQWIYKALIELQQPYRELMIYKLKHKHPWLRDDFGT